MGQGLEDIKRAKNINYDLESTSVHYQQNYNLIMSLPRMWKFWGVLPSSISI